MSDDKTSGRGRIRSVNQTVAVYAAAVSSVEPTPGGGSVIATVSALAASLAAMVCRLSLNRKLDQAKEERLLEALESADRLRQRFLELASDDETAYSRYRNAAALPKTTPEEISAREDAIETALHESASVPLSVATSLVDLLATLRVAAVDGTKHAQADVATSANLALAALKCAVTMISANTDLMKDRDAAQRFDQSAGSRLADGTRLAAQVIPSLA